MFQNSASYSYLIRCTSSKTYTFNLEHCHILLYTNTQSWGIAHSLLSLYLFFILVAGHQATWWFPAFSGLAKWALPFWPMASLVLWILREAKTVCYFCSCSDMWLEVSYVQQNEKSFSAQSSLRPEPSIRK